MNFANFSSLEFYFIERREKMLYLLLSKVLNKVQNNSKQYFSKGVFVVVSNFQWCKSGSAKFLEFGSLKKNLTDSTNPDLYRVVKLKGKTAKTLLNFWYNLFAFYHSLL